MKENRYKLIKDKEKIIKKIDSLEGIAREYIMKIDDLYIEDLFFVSIIDKSMKLIDSFLFALNDNNITVLATLTRIQLDCSIRAFASTMVKDSNSF